jgi:hypothetical protein
MSLIHLMFRTDVLLSAEQHLTGFVSVMWAAS